MNGNTRQPDSNVTSFQPPVQKKSPGKVGRSMTLRCRASNVEDRATENTSNRIENSRRCLCGWQMLRLRIPIQIPIQDPFHRALVRFLLRSRHFPRHNPILPHLSDRRFPRWQVTISPQSRLKHINYPAEQDDFSHPQDEVMEKFVTPHTTKAPVLEGDFPGFMGQSCEEARLLHRSRSRG